MVLVSHWRRSLSLALAAGLLVRRGVRDVLDAEDGRARLRRAPTRASASRPASWTPQEAVWNVKVVSKTPPSEKFLGSTNSDLAFTGNYASRAATTATRSGTSRIRPSPCSTSAYYCPASQSDVSVYKNLLFVSGEGNSGRLDCGDQGVKDTVSRERLRGIRIFDITRHHAPEERGQRADVPRLAHAHAAGGPEGHRQRLRLHLGLGGRALAERAAGLLERDAGAGSQLGALPDRSDQGAARASRAGGDRQLAAHLQRSRRADAARRGAGGHRGDQARGGQRARGGRVHRRRHRHGAGAARRASPRRCSTASSKAQRPHGRRPAADSAARARRAAGDHRRRCSASRRTPRPEAGSHAVPRHHASIRRSAAPAARARAMACCSTSRTPCTPTRIGAVADSNFSYWHSATFNNDGTKLLFSDEWGGGGAAEVPRHRPEGMGRRRALHDRERQDAVFQGYYKLPAAQTAQENCVAHNGSLIPIPGRDVMVQAWYQGGISVFDWTDAAHPKEIAYFDRGPVDSTRMSMGGSWSVYWYNGVIVSSEIARGLDIFELTPSAPHLAERDRRGEDGAPRLPEHAGSAAVRLAGELRARGRVPRSARA